MTLILQPEFEQRILKALERQDNVCREEFLPPFSGPKKLAQKRYNQNMAACDRAMKALVLKGWLFTCQKSGQYSFFKHRGRYFPKVWRRRREPEISKFNHDL